MDHRAPSAMEVCNLYTLIPPKPERGRKKLKLELKTPPTSDIAKLRQQICDHKRKCLDQLKDAYRDNLTELFYLQNGLNYMDIAAWRKKSNVNLTHYIKSYSLEQVDDPVVIKHEPAVNTAQQKHVEGLKLDSRRHSISSPSTPTRAVNSELINEVEVKTPMTTESIIEQAKKEAQVMQRVAELRKNGLWTAKRMPKVQEPVRNKAHWDYLLEEMQWLAADFAQERKWKKAGCRKISRMIMRYHQDRMDDEKRAGKEEGTRLRRIAGQLAKQIKDFWSNIEKVVQYKQDSRLDEKRRQALDMHLNFIVDQTEKYSSWLSAGLAGTAADTSGGSTKVDSSVAVSPKSSIAMEDVEFMPTAGSSDDEETIAKEEELHDTDQNDTDAELAALQAESEMPLEDLLASLPQGVLDQPAALDSDSSASVSDDDKMSEDFDGERVEAVDDEKTLDEQEEHEEKDYKNELDDLKNEGEMTVEELAAKYCGAYASDFELPDTPSSTEVDSDDGEDEDQETSSEEEDLSVQQDAEQEEVGMEYLLHPERDEVEILSDQEGKEGPNKEITDIAAAAQMLQPTGYTLETTEVKTTVPFLLQHTLREYQHVGLDWLATMYEKKLNGILADEMGLGKTIQTIALLAHLACDHGIWGPHLIVVPTSVMLNWEMELKKWCPGFKILTYYGSQKERKMKRIGWTKTNAFHVCITSYKLVIQDHQAFKRKKWRYLILDEAQNIKNFKSQRWQTLLNFNSQRRLLLTGTPLQNNLMELWSLMHFLMPNVFQSHMEFKEWFANPLTGMIEGTSEYNDQLIKRLHKVLRPFLLRRLKADVEKQLPQKYEHVVMCRLSKRQRLLYEEFMSRRDTKDTLAGGNFMSVIGILMQLRKVCNHPDMFDPRPIISPFETDSIPVETAAAVLRALNYDPLQELKLNSLHPNLPDMESDLSAYAAHRSRKLQTSRKLIEIVDQSVDPPIRPPPTKLRPFVIRSPTPSQTQINASSTAQVVRQAGRTVSITSSIMKPTVPKAVGPSLSSLVTQTGGVARTPVMTKSPSASQPITLQIQQTPQGTRLMIPSSQLPQLQAGLVHIIQTSSGQHLITSAASTQSLTSTATTASGATSTAATRVLPISSLSSNSGTGALSLAARLTSTTATGAPVATVDPMTGRPVLRTSLVSSAQAPARSPGMITVASASSSLISRSATPTVVTSAGSIARVTTLTNGTSAGAAITKTLQVVKATPTVSSTSGTSVTAHKSNKPTLMGPASRKRALETEARNKFVAELNLDTVNGKLSEWRKSTLDRLAEYNKKHCGYKPVYGFDLHGAVNVWKNGLHKSPTYFSGNSLAHCHNAVSVTKPNHPRYYWSCTEYLRKLILTPEERLEQMTDLVERFVFVTPPVKSRGVQLHVSCHSDLVDSNHLIDYQTKSLLTEKSNLLHPIQTRMLVQFPDKRLIQYDCGKLQTLDILLRDLKSGKHRVLIFTQMTRMLDVLEAFLNYHGHRYLRLDGTTKVEMRQHLMDRFNADSKIFVMILSTRSGGVGVNLTGADTVIFYDSDWNPTMDAQAQDRCHRIGQTRDVHIYRLVSEKTVEENILKKANQKRMLGDVAIEGGNFTTASLQQGTIADLFAEPSGLNTLAERKPVHSVASSSSLNTVPANSVAPSLNEKQFEQALCQAEDVEDVRAAAVASEEAGAELAEFDENIPWDEREAELKKQQAETTSKVEMEIAMIEKELTPVERYAVIFLEKTDDQFTEEAVNEAEMDIEQAKKDWELNRLKSQREEEERKAELEEDDMLYTYSKEDGMNQAFKDAVTGENMPMWCPPTPPHSENDVYVDQSICFLYDSAIMTESQLPPVHVKKEKKRKIDTHSLGITKKKARMVLEEAPRQQPAMSNRPPRSLFDRPHLLKLKREKTLLKHPSMAGQLGMKMGASGNLQKPSGSDSSHQDQPEWLIHEDWSLLQAVQTLLQLPLNLTVMSPAHIPNWDLVSDIVSTTSRIYRSPKQCRLRYENVIIPREEGKVVFEPNPRKPQKKIPKSVYKTKGNKPLSTGVLYTQDSGSSVTTLHAFRFDCIKNVASKRTPTLRPTLVNPTMKNPKHAAVIAESGIQYDSPMNPEKVAKIRQERIRNEKKQAAAEQQQRASQTAAAAAASASRANTVQLQHLPVSGTTAIISPATKSALQASGVSIARNAGSIVVPGSSTFSPLNHRKLTQTTSVISGVSQVTHSAPTAGRKMTVGLQEIQRLGAGSTTMAQFMRHVQQGNAAVTQGAASRTITVQQQPLAIGKSLTPTQLTQLNLLSQQQQAKRVAQTGAQTLVHQRSSSGASQLFSGQQLQQAVVDQSRVPTLVKTVSSVSGGTQGTTSMSLPVNTGVNINVSLPQQQKTLPVQGTTKATLTGGQPPQYRQIQLLHNKTVARPITQKLSLTHPQLVGKTGASVQIVQQKIGKQIGVQQIQQLIKQQQAQQAAAAAQQQAAAAQQHAQIITAPAGTSVSGQTIIATTQLITPANMHATITKMSTPSSAGSSSGVSNVTVSLARPVITSSTPVAIVPGAGASLVSHSPSKLVATTIPRSATTHKVAGTITGIVGNTGVGATPVVSLASVTLQSQPSVSSSLMKTLSPNAFHAIQQASRSAASAGSASGSSTPAGATVLQQTILTNRPSSVSTPATVTITPTSVVQAASTPPPPQTVVTHVSTPTVVVPVESNRQSVTLQPTAVGSTVTVSTTPELSNPVQVSEERSNSPDMGDVQTTPDATRTYAMRPRKTN